MRWFVLDHDAQVLAVHAALLHTGQIIYFGGDENDQKQHNRAVVGDLSAIEHTRLFDCNSLAVLPTPSATSDIFCSNQVLLADGRLLIAGGTEAFPPEAPGQRGLDPFSWLSVIFRARKCE